MTDRELFKMALDMLDDINQCSLPPTGIPLPAEIDHVMEALRARLTQPEPEPVAWMHDETGLIVRVSDIAKTSYNEPRIKSGEFSPLYASQPDHTKAMRLALEIIRLQREWIMAVPQDTVLPSMPGFDREWVDRQIAALEKELT